MPDRLPWAKWEWDRWETEETLRECSLASQGLWMRLLCVMSKNAGKLLINGKPPGIPSIARLGHVDAAEVLPLLQELEREGVFSRDGAGVIYCRRMAKGSHKSSATKCGSPKCGSRKPMNQQEDSGLLKLESESESESPLTPSGGPISDRDVEEVWKIASQISRGRSSRDQVREAMEAARHRGHKVAAIIAGVLGYYRSLDAKRDGGKFVMGLHRLKSRRTSFLTLRAE